MIAAVDFGATEISAAVGLAGAIVAVFASYAMGKKALAEAQKLKEPETAPHTPYEALASRVTALEVADQEKGKELHRAGEEIHRLRNQFRRLAGVFLRDVAHLVSWIDSGAEPPPPIAEMKLIREIITELDEDVQDHNKEKDD